MYAETLNQSRSKNFNRSVDGILVASGLIAKDQEDYARKLRNDIACIGFLTDDPDNDAQTDNCEENDLTELAVDLNKYGSVDCDNNKMNVVSYFQHAYPEQGKDPLTIGVIPAIGTHPPVFAVWPKGCRVPLSLGTPFQDRSEFEAEAFLEIGTVKELYAKDGFVEVPGWRPYYFKQVGNLWYFADWYELRVLHTDEFRDALKQVCKEQ